MNTEMDSVNNEVNNEVNTEMKSVDIQQIIDSSIHIVDKFIDKLMIFNQNVQNDIHEYIEYLLLTINKLNVLEDKEFLKLKLKTNEFIKNILIKDSYVINKKIEILNYIIDLPINNTLTDFLENRHQELLEYYILKSSLLKDLLNTQ